MRTRHGVTGRAGRIIGAMLVWVLAAALLGLAYAERSHAAVPPADKLEATIFSYDGTDFIRSKTTLVTAEGKSAANTKLDHETAAFSFAPQSRRRRYRGELARVPEQTSRPRFDGEAHGPELAPVSDT